MALHLELSLSLPGGGFGGGRGGRGDRGGRGGRGRGRGGSAGRGDRPKVHTDRLGFATSGPAALNSKQRAIKKSSQHRQKRNALHYKATKKYGTDLSQTNAAYRAAFGEDDEASQSQDEADGEEIGTDGPNSTAGGSQVAEKPKKLSALEYERRAYLQSRGLDEETRRQEKKEAVRAAAERHVKKKQRDKVRAKMLQRDRRGQPKAKHMIEHLLEKIQAAR